MTLLAVCSAVVVFPHHFAPSISTAPFASNAFHGRYYIIFSHHTSIPLWNLAHFRCGTWRVFVVELGALLLWNVAHNCALKSFSRGYRRALFCPRQDSAVRPVSALNTRQKYWADAKPERATTSATESVVFASSLFASDSRLSISSC